MDLELIDPPDEGAALTVVSTADQRRHMRITSSSRDDIIEQTVRDAVAQLHGPGGELRRTVIPCTWKLWLSEFPDCERSIELPLPPLVEVTEISYLDLNGTGQTVDPSLYAVVPGSLCGNVFLLRGKSWPLTLAHPRAIGIEFSAGYDWSALTHPHCQQIKRAVKMLAAHFYENSEATVIEGRLTIASKKLEFGLNFILDRLRVPLRYD